jgi:hypothetical protein
MILKPQDIVILLKILSVGEHPWTYASLAFELEISTSQLHSAVKRALSSQLAVQHDSHIVPNVRNLKEFLIHGLKYVFVPDRGEITRGIPTGYASPFLESLFVSDGDPIPVWPHPEGKARGMSFSPLYKIAPAAALRDKRLYELLALIDAIRGGRARELKVAINHLDQLLDQYASQI